MNKKRTKRIFVSDIHMGDENSINPVGGLKPYGWLKEDHASKFANFLKFVISDSDVKQLIILGDLFDEWVCPAEVKPISISSSEQYKKIASAPQNVGIIENLKLIAASDNIELVYVPGNHDMLVSKDILTDIIPGIKFIDSTYSEDGIAAEHGSNYCLFNAPDKYNNKGHSLPLGFFIARAVAEKAARKGHLTDTVKAIKDSIEGILHREKIGSLVLNAVTEDSGMTKESSIIMNGIDGYESSIKVEEIESIFGDIYHQWGEMKPYNIPNEEALINDSGHLYPAAISQYFIKNDEPDIVIFGHTHKHDLHSIPLPDFSSEKEHHLFPCRHIYANCGTWINGKECTYVESNIENGKHYVRVMKYIDSDKAPAVEKIGERHRNL